MTLEVTQTIPLTLWEDGTIRVKGTRLLIDMIVDAHNRGECPEDIFESFPSDVYTIADIYAVIAYYLSNKPKIDKYLADGEKKAEETWKKIEALPGYQENRRKLKETLAARLKNKK